MFFIYVNNVLPKFCLYFYFLHFFLSCFELNFGKRPKFSRTRGCPSNSIHTIFIVLTVLMQILRHLTFFWPKVHFLGQILDFNGQICSLNITAPKIPGRKLEQRRSICVDTVLVLYTLLLLIEFDTDLKNVSSFKIKSQYFFRYIFFQVLE